MKEEEIRPERLLEKYLELTKSDISKYFLNSQSRNLVSCVACGHDKSNHEFYKDGFEYQSCGVCLTLFLNPRPSLSTFEKFYKYSASSEYWAKVFFPSVAEVRREKIFKGRVENLNKWLQKLGIKVNQLVDVGAGYGIFLEEWLKKSPNTNTLAIEPSSDLADYCRAKNIPVIEDMLENIDIEPIADLATCFEVLEHVYDPLSFIKKMATLVKPGGHVFISSLSIDGFDLQVLWDKSKQISPPHHINFMSMKGFEMLFRSAGLQNIKLITPGKLDVDIVRNAMIAHNSELKLDRFLNSYMKSEETMKALQDFIVLTKKSSHVWITGQKPQR